MRKKSIFFFVAFLALTCIIALLILKSTTSAPRFSVGESSEEHEILFPVARVIDGDTIDIILDDSHTERIRFIGIDTPETVDERKKVQCYGPESSAHMKELLSGKSVALETKPDEDRDDYGRLLRYVILDGKDIGAAMIEEGYARSLCFAFPHPRCDDYDKLEREARRLKRGRWGVCQ